MKLWEDNDRREAALDELATQEEKANVATLEGVVATAFYAVVQLFRQGKLRLLRELVEAIPRSEFRDEEERQEYIASFLAGEENPLRCALVLLYQGVVLETREYQGVATVEGEARYLTANKKLPKPTPKKKLSSGLRGVGLHRGRWRAEVSQSVHGVVYKKYLGSFDSKAAAAQRHDEWVRQHIGAEGKLSTDTVYHKSSTT